MGLPQFQHLKMAEEIEDMNKEMTKNMYRLQNGFVWRVKRRQLFGFSLCIPNPQKWVMPDKRVSSKILVLLWQILKLMSFLRDRLEFGVGRRKVLYT